MHFFHPHHAHRRFHDEQMHAIGRGGGRFGGGPFGFDDREGMRGGRGGGRFGGRMFGSGDLRLLLLALIEEQPRHGYELIRTIEEMFEDPQVKARELRVDLEAADGTVIPGVRSPIVLSETPLHYSRPSPKLGEHTAEVLAELAQLENKGKQA